MNKRRVLVTGLGMVTALGLDVKSSWQKALDGVCAIGRVTGAPNSPVQAVAEVNGADFLAIQERFKEDALKEGERRTMFALQAGYSSLADANLLEQPGQRWRMGVSLAAGLPINRLEDVAQWLTPQGQFDIAQFGRQCSQVQKDSIMRNNSNRAAAVVARRLQLWGPNCTVTTACASATQAIGTAFRMIRDGEADVMVCGGADSMINPVGLVFFVLLGAACTTTDRVEEACRPFDRRRSGLVMGEGAGLVVLEEQSHAIKRGARVYAEVAGYASSLDAYQVTAPPADGAGAVASMSGALADSYLRPQDIDYINAHGTSTKLNDRAETLAIKEVFKGHAHELVVSSSKSIFGHMLAASGGPEFVFTVLSVYTDEIHPTVNLTQPDPKCDLNYAPGKKISYRGQSSHDKSDSLLTVTGSDSLLTVAGSVRAALSNSFGFGGQNSSIIVKKWERRE
ncbi:MAG: beta-ketoacyl-[acyl-carrier-protein] synthase family protein [Nitrospirae bacterium]|nr:beta-ketoacyl-[acyl-carrier-protein] synthase family protein [Nitrospirota bacterium]MBF0592727.1 beta-ketoacyl-[acyl-carrier-protein] synthase family protein [Nitrospirota bacterium]